jgi:hypothetical protein
LLLLVMLKVIVYFVAIGDVKGDCLFCCYW